jgi:NADH-quinone oxidoreductase subunit H
MAPFITPAIIDFRSIYDLVGMFVPSGMEWLAYGIAAFLLVFIVINAMVLSTAAYIWFERRVIGRFQSRLGPNRWGPFGLFQPIADLIKLLLKEDVVPDVADKPVFRAAPIAFFVSTILVVAVVPFGPDSFMGKLNVGILFVVGVTSANTIAIFMGGVASRNKYSMLGAMRAVSMLISYEVPMALAITGVLMLAGSMALFDIVAGQTVPFALVMPLGLFVFIASASAEMSRTPFDMIESESELGAGYHTEYSGMKFALFQLAEFMAPLVTSIIATTLFFGGTRGFDPIPGQVWFGLKVFLTMFGFLWLRATWPRLRIDQIMSFAWKALMAMGFLNFGIIAVEAFILIDPATGAIPASSMWLMAGINWIIAIVTLIVVARLMGQRKLERRAPTPSPLANMYAEAD